MFYSLLSILFVLSGSPSAHALDASEITEARRFIRENYAELLTDPQKKNRMSLAQFGYRVSYSRVPFFRLTEFIDPNHYGIHSYGRPNRAEKNGVIYSCRGGFIDFSHMRAGVDWSTHLTLKFIESESDAIELRDESGKLEMKRNASLSDLTLADIARAGQKAAFERLTWHEIVSWHRHRPNALITEQQSTFSIEDSYSNLLGTEIGRRVAIRILTKRERKSYAEIASEEIRRAVDELAPRPDVRQSKAAYDLVDHEKQSKRNPDVSQADVWWDSDVILNDQRYVFKRVLPLSESVAPWLVPGAETIGCADAVPLPLEIPQRDSEGGSLHAHYEISITPDPAALFYSKRDGAELHPPFGAFTTKDISDVIRHVGAQMEKILGPGFDGREKRGAIESFSGLKRVYF